MLQTKILILKELFKNIYHRNQINLVIFQKKISILFIMTLLQLQTLRLIML